MKNKKTGGAFIAIGLLFLLAAAGLTGNNLYRNEKAGNTASEIAEQFSAHTTLQPPENTSEPAYKLYPDMEMPVTQMQGIDIIGMLDLPTLSLSLPVAAEYADETLWSVPCRYKGSAYTDNLIVCAHNYTVHFGRLSELSYGDRIRFTDADGNVFLYSVAEMEVLDGTAVEEMENSDHALTLFTCTLSGADRITVRCEKAGN